MRREMRHFLKLVTIVLRCVPLFLLWACAAYVFVLVRFMSETATGNAFFRSCCVGGVGTLAASTERSAGEEALNATGI